MNNIKDRLHPNVAAAKEVKKKGVSFFATLGLKNVENTLHKIPFIGNALPFLIVNLFVAILFYYLCYGPLWLFSSIAEEEGQWFIRRTNILGKSYSRLTIYAAEQIAYFVAGFAACLFTYANYSDNDKSTFILRTTLVSLIPIGFLLITKAFPAMLVYIPIGFVYGQFAAIIVACFVKLVGGDKKDSYEKS